MLGTSKSSLLSSFFSVYSRRLIRRKFHSLNARGFSRLAEVTSGVPLIIYCNHSSWWDGIVVFQMMRMAMLNGFILMEDRQLERYPLFAKFGAVPISREHPRNALRSLKSVGELLAETDRSAVTIFPQGEIVSNQARPILFETGIARLARFTGDCETISLALQFRFGSHFKPELFVSLGQRMRVSARSDLTAKALTDLLRQDLTAGLDDLSACMSQESPAGFVRLI